jgi:hypothetical protein
MEDRGSKIEDGRWRIEVTEKDRSASTSNPNPQFSILYFLFSILGLFWNFSAALDESSMAASG